MKISLFAAASVVLSSLLVVACDPQSPEPDPSGEETGTGSSTTYVQTESGATAGETEEPATSGSSTDSPPVPSSCEEATTPEECAAVSDAEYATCGWFATTIAEPAVDASCQSVGTSGVCVLVDRLDGCEELFADDACGPESGTRFVRTLDDGRVEIVADPSGCGSVADFEPCPWYESDEAVDDALRAACTCACML